MTPWQYSLMRSAAANNAAAGWSITFDRQEAGRLGEARLTRRVPTYRDHAEPYRCHMTPVEDGVWGYTVLSTLDGRTLESGTGTFPEVFKMLNSKS
jgi:hypothetical protein